MTSVYFEDTRLIYVLLAIIVLLSAYTIYLNIRILKEKMLFRNIIKSITGDEREHDVKELQGMLAEFRRFNIRNNIRDSKILEHQIMEFILDMEQERNIYLHYTMLEEDARNIISEGFRFAESFYRTAVPVSSDKLDLLMKHNDKRFYGDFVIVICISRSVVDKCTGLLEKTGLRNYSFENILTGGLPVKNENSDTIFLLPAQYIKGYFNHRTGEIFSNEIFDPSFVTPDFARNLEILQIMENKKANPGK